LTIIPSLLHAELLQTAADYQKNEQFNQAINCYEEIITHTKNDLVNSYFNAGCCYLAIGNKEKAIESFSRVLEISPRSVAAHYNLGYTYKTFGELDRAIAIYNDIIAQYPDYDAAHLALGFTYITQGNFEKGWKQHTRYLKQSGKNGDRLRQLLQNNDITYKTILLGQEGGLGDIIHYIRYAELLKNMGADVIVSCQKQLIPLLSRCPYIDQLIPSGQAMPSYDAEATLMSLPAIFNDNDQTAPRTIPYIFPEPALVDYWKQQLAGDSNFKVGICWQVDAHNDLSKIAIARRGYPLASFATLADIPNISFYSLQKYDGTEQISSLPSHFSLHTFENFDEAAGPFMDTAALLQNLDLVITVDTAVAHLAGAVGCTVWLLHPYATADCRWIHGKNDSYWYPTMRIFKQHKAFGYDEVLEEVKIELSRLIQPK
jgi:tetratricopeptide (TPR) repeat protein